MLSIFASIAPVFILIAIGYVAVRSGYLKVEIGDQLSAFAVKLAVPMLLFRALSELDFSQAFSPPLLISFYTGAFSCFAIGIVLARRFFGKRPGESVAFGFSATFSNTVLLGIVIAERSYGAGVMPSVFAIVAVHAPLVYIAGTLTMEMMRRDGRPLGETIKTAGWSIITNPLMVGILAGAIVNFSGLPVPGFISAPVNMLASAAIPAALVGIGAAMTKFELTAAMRETLTVSALSLLVHPAITFVLAYFVFGLPEPAVIAAVTLASMPPGVNIYIFATMYDRGVSLAASAFVIATVLSVVTITIWLSILRMLFSA